MKKIILLFVVTIRLGYANAQQLVGIWQYSTAELSSGYIETYQFFSDGKFRFNTSQYDALARIKTIGGKYKVENKRIVFFVEYTIEDEGGVPKIGEISSGSDSWAIMNGKRVKKHLLKVIKQYAELELSDKSRNPSWICINRMKYYKVHNNPDNFN